MRRSFLYPIPQIEIAINYLDEAVDHYLSENNELAAEMLVQADMEEIAAYYKLIVGKTRFPVHWQHRQPQSIEKNERIQTRMPPANVTRNIFERDGWRCRYCGTRVFSAKARRRIIDAFPTETHWVEKEYERHAALTCQAASLDHILPHSRGGDNSEDNLVTACGPCQYGRNQWTIDEFGFYDPRQFTPEVDSWDGLTRIERKIT